MKELLERKIGGKKSKIGSSLNTSLKVLTDPLDLTDQQSGSGWWMASLHGEVGTRPYLAGDC